jgi:hypothetical protein
MRIFLVGMRQGPRIRTTLPRNLEEMKESIVAAVSTIDSDMLQRVWDE